MDLNNAIIDTRVELQTAGLKKSGKNSFAGFQYFELGDFLPTLNVLMQKAGINDQFSIDGELAQLKLIKGTESQNYTLPFTHYTTPVNKQGNPSMQDIQYLGAIITYYKRYLYMNAFGITDGEIVDSMEMPTRRTYNTWSKATESDKLQYKKEFLVKCEDLGVDRGNITDFFDFLGVDHTNDHEKHNTIVQYLRSGELFEEQIEMYKSWKEKQAVEEGA